MRIRTILILSFLIATLVPSTMFGYLSYKQSLKRELSEVSDRHLLLAHNLGMSLKRYRDDLTRTLDAASSAIIDMKSTDNLYEHISMLNIENILIVDENTGKVSDHAGNWKTENNRYLTTQLIDNVKTIAKIDSVSFSSVMDSGYAGNVILGVRKYRNKLAIAVIKTDYFVELGRSISFGKKGHAAIVDAEGNVLSHPLSNWVAQRKNISKVSAVQRMMKGETGIEQFYSPALKGDMIAGLTSVSGPNWGVMIPQPIEEFYAKVNQSYKTKLAVLVFSLLLTTLLVVILLNSLASPIERILRTTRTNAVENELNKTCTSQGVVPITEISDFMENYNYMIDRVTFANAKTLALAYRDGLTGLPNREKFRETAQAILDEPNSIGGSLVFIDLDNFKQINDLHGHAIGDKFLIECASKLTYVVHSYRELRPRAATDCEEPMVARVGGDEFAIIYPGLVNEGEVLHLLQKIQKEMSIPCQDLNFITKRSVSIGCSRFPKDSNQLDELKKLADLAMYHAKRAGKNNYQLYSEEIGTLSASEIVAHVEHAIDNDELTLEYQPKVQTHDWKVRGVEALVRWDHPTNGRIQPDVWIPAISKSPVMKKLGEWVVARAMDDHEQWVRSGLDEVTVAVNIGSQHFSASDFVENLSKIARSKNFNPRNMEIEITEDALFVSERGAKKTIEKLRQGGFYVAIDDFGKGYSNIARFCELPVDYLKIDRSIVASAANDARVASMLGCVIAMAQQLDCKTIAEGIETNEDQDRIVAGGVDVLQGFHFSGSLTPRELIRWVKQHNSNDDNGVLEYLQSDAA